MAGLRDIKRRIKSVQSTRKITRAMQMVSAAKMRKAQNAVITSRTYAALAWDLIGNIARKGSYTHPLITAYPNAEKIGIILLSSNRGLVGSLNINLFSKLKELEHEDPLYFEIIAYGKIGKTTAFRLKKNVIADFEKLEKSPTSEDIYPLAQFAAEAYASGKYKKIIIIYNHFVSTLVQKASHKQLLPFTQSIREELESKYDEPTGEDADYIFEPDAVTVLNHLLPRILESQLYSTILESDASEHSARMVMMKNATEAAGDLISDYTLTYNQIRQNKITTELAEITAGRIALE